MGNDKTKKSNRWKIPAIINLCLIIMCSVAFGTYALTARADTTDKAAAVAGEEWYEVDDSGEELAVFLKNRVNGYGWKYGTSNDTLRQLHGYEIQEEDLDDERAEAWRLYLVPRDEEDGDVEITFVCIKDSESDSIDTRTLKVRVRDGKIQVIDG